ncbi:hypothetical protein TeGR_g2689, partial [Tetraparma gracilis]
CVSDKCTLLALSKEAFEKYLGNLDSLMQKCVLKRILMSIPVFSRSLLQSFEIEAIFNKIKRQEFGEGEGLGRPDDPCIYLLREGVVTTTAANGVVNNMSRGDYFGGDDWGDGQSKVGKTVAIAASRSVVVDVLKRSDVYAILKDPKRLGRPIPPKTRSLNNAIRFEHLDKLKILGIGTFGRVWIVKDRSTSTSFALKILDKAQIIAHHQTKGVIREKSIMATLNHPFIVHLVSVYKDDTSLYMLIDLLQGGELFSVLHTKRYDGVPLDHASFYACNILGGLYHMHSRSIIYRDLKPENVMIDRDGYPVIVDLGFAKVVETKTYTLCGTPEYLAPEIILSKGHDK